MGESGKGKGPAVAVALAAFALGVLVGARACAPDAAPVALPPVADAPVGAREARELPAWAPAPPVEERQGEIQRESPREERLGAPDAAVVPGEDEEPVCHVRPSGGSPAATHSARSTQNLELELVNDCDEPVLLAWVDFDGNEQRPSVVLAGGTWRNTTFSGHVFRVRAADRKRSFVRDLVAPASRGEARAYACGCSPDALHAVNVPVVTDAGHADGRPLPRCPVPFETEPSNLGPASPPSKERVQVKLRNTCGDTRLLMRWVRLDGGLRDGEEILPGHAGDYPTYVGHRFQLYDGTTGRWIRSFEIDGGTEVDLCPCPP